MGLGAGERDGREGPALKELDVGKRLRTREGSASQFKGLFN